MKFDKIFVSLYGFYIAVLLISDYILCLRVTQAPTEKPINLKVIPSRMNKLTMDDLDQIKMEVLHDMNSQLKDLEDEMAEKQNLKEKTSSSWSITGAPIYLPRDPNEPGKMIPTKNKKYSVKSPAQENFSKDIKKMLSFKELENQLREADDVLNDLKKLKAEKEKKRKEFLNQKFKEKTEKGKSDTKEEKTGNKVEDNHKNFNGLDKEKSVDNKKTLLKSTNSTINGENLNNQQKNSNSTHSEKSSNSKSNANIESFDIKKKISESLEPFENEIKKLLNINSFNVNDLILKANKTSDSVELEKKEKSEKHKISEKSEKNSVRKISESTNKNSEKTSEKEENSETNSETESKDAKSKTDDTANKEISNSESSALNSSPNRQRSTKENLKLAKEMNQELKQETKDFQSNFLKDIGLKQEIGEIKSNIENNSANDSTFVAAPSEDESSFYNSKQSSKGEKNLTSNDLNKLKKDVQGEPINQTGNSNNISLLQTNIAKSSNFNQPNNFAFNNSANLLEDGNLKLPDGPILDLPFFGMI